MYNSFVISILAKSWNVLQEGYEYSILKRINTFFIGGFKKLSKGSKIIKLFTSNRNLIEESFLYKLYGKLIDRINAGFNSIENHMKNICRGSIVYNSIYNLFKDETSRQTASSLFFIVLGVGVIVINLIKGLNSYKFYLVPIVLIISSLLVIGSRISCRGILKGSYTFNLIKDIFSIDEGVDQWW